MSYLTPVRGTLDLAMRSVYIPKLNSKEALKIKLDQF